MVFGGTERLAEIGAESEGLGGGIAVGEAGFAVEIGLAALGGFAGGPERFGGAGFFGGALMCREKCQCDRCQMNKHLRG
jgi:hypothetical protein